MIQPYIVLEQFPFNSKFGGIAYKITLVGAKDRKIYKTYVDPRMNNFELWAHIIHNPTHGFVLNGLKIKKDDIITADSHAVIEWETEDPSTIANDLSQIWAEEDHRKTATTFRELFDYDKKA